MSDHFIERCKVCNTVIAQCRCMDSVHGTLLKRDDVLKLYD